MLCHVLVSYSRNSNFFLGVFKLNSKLQYDNFTYFLPTRTHTNINKKFS